MTDEIYHINEVVVSSGVVLEAICEGEHMTEKHVNTFVRSLLGDCVFFVKACTGYTYLFNTFGLCGHKRLKPTYLEIMKETLPLGLPINATGDARYLE